MPCNVTKVDFFLGQCDWIFCWSSFAYLQISFLQTHTAGLTQICKGLPAWIECWLRSPAKVLMPCALFSLISADRGGHLVGVTSYSFNLRLQADFFSALGRCFSLHPSLSWQTFIAHTGALPRIYPGKQAHLNKELRRNVKGKRKQRMGKRG